MCSSNTNTKEAVGFLSKVNGFLKVITESIKLIVGLFAAIAALIAYFGYGLGSSYPEPPKACIKVDDIDIPGEVAFNEWDNMKISVKGKNQCPEKEFGMYVTFMRRGANNSPIRLGVPYEDKNQCKGRFPQSIQCWDSKKPISTNSRGEWEWEIFPPILNKMRDLNDTENLTIRWAVHEYKGGSTDPIWVNQKTIRLTDAPLL